MVLALPVRITYGCRPEPKAFMMNPTTPTPEPEKEQGSLGLDLEPGSTPRLRNQRRIEPIARLIILFIGLQVLLLVAAGIGLKWSFDRYVAPRLNSAEAMGQSAEFYQMQERRRAALQELREKLAESLLTDDPTIAEPLRMVDELAALDATLSLPFDPVGPAGAEGEGTAADGSPVSRLVDADAATINDLMALRGRILAELLILKERNRLTGYADEAIVTGDRRAYELLWDALDNPDLHHLRHAARSEILRVKFFYNSDERILAFTIPVELFTDDPDIRTERDLNAAQLRELLANHSLDWRIRVRAAFLLAQFPEIETGDSLVEAIMTDPHLAVVKESVFALGQFTGYRGDVLEFEQVRDFWEQAKRASSEDAPPSAIPVDPPGDAPPDANSSAEGQG